MFPHFKTRLTQWSSTATPAGKLARQLSVRFEGVRQLFEKESSTLLLGRHSWTLGYSSYIVV